MCSDVDICSFASGLIRKHGWQISSMNEAVFQVGISSMSSGAQVLLNSFVLKSKNGLGLFGSFGIDSLF